MTKREIRKRVKQLIARELRGAFSEPPGHIEDEPIAVQEAWTKICLEVANALDRGNRA